MNNLEIVNEIKKNKKLFKITSLELSKKSGVPLGTLNKILANKTESLKVETLNKINSVFNLNSNKLKQLNDYGFVRVGACSPSLRVADISYNAEQIKNEINKASLKGVELLVFPELSITSSTCFDLYYQSVLLDSAISALLDLKDFSKNYEMVILLGLPLKFENKLYSVSAVLCKGEILGFVPKSYIPSYNEFYEDRYFNGDLEGIKFINIGGKEYPFSKNLIFKHLGKENFAFAIEISSDLYKNIPPSSIHASKGALICVNLASSNEVVGRISERKNLILSQSKKGIMGYVYSNASWDESTTDLIYSGHSLICENGEILKESQLFTKGLIISDIDVDYLSFIRSKERSLESLNVEYKQIYFEIDSKKDKVLRDFSKYPFVPNKKDDKTFELILEMQSHALARRIKHVNAKKIVLGLSGGLDSTLALIVCVRAMDILKRDRKDVLTITMPCFGTTLRTKNNAVILAEKYEVSLKEINIKNSVREHFKDIGHDENLLDVTYENAQARERTQVLMDIANSQGGLVIGTGDLSEIALGWSTYNGDHMSMYAVNGSIPKTLIRFLINYEAQKEGGEIKNTLLDIIDTPVSPELIPPKEGEIVQKTEDNVGPYILQDFYLYYAIYMGYKPSKIFKIAKQTFTSEYSSEELLKWLKHFYNRFFTQQFKRSCMPDGVKITRLGLSPRGDLKMPSDAVKNVWLEDLENIEL